MIDIQDVISTAKSGRSIAHTQGQFTVAVDYPCVSVYETTPRGVQMVAHSSMRADFEASLEEFVRDYLPGSL